MWLKWWLIPLVFFQFSSFSLADDKANAGVPERPEGLEAVERTVCVWDIFRVLYAEYTFLTPFHSVVRELAESGEWRSALLETVGGRVRYHEVGRNDRRKYLERFHYQVMGSSREVLVEFNQKLTAQSSARLLAAIKATTLVRGDSVLSYLRKIAAEDEKLTGGNSPSIDLVISFIPVFSIHETDLRLSGLNLLLADLWEAEPESYLALVADIRKKIEVEKREDAAMNLNRQLESLMLEMRARSQLHIGTAIGVGAGIAALIVYIFFRG